MPELTPELLASVLRLARREYLRDELPLRDRTDALAVLSALAPEPEAEQAATSLHHLRRHEAAQAELKSVVESSLRKS